MDCRESLHSMIELLEDCGVFEGRKVTIEVVNGTHVKWHYEPPIEPYLLRAIEAKETMAIAANGSRIH